MNRYLVFPFIVLFIFITSCDQDEDVRNALLSSSDIDEIIRYAEKANKLNDKGVPILLDAIINSLAKQHNMSNYGKINVCLLKLNEMVDRGVFTNDEPRILLDIMRKQKYVSDMILTAEIVRKITGTDVELNKEFFDSYTEDHEESRLRLIDEWEQVIDHWLSVQGVGTVDREDYH